MQLETKTRHTPGPWEINGGAIETVSRPSVVVAHVYQGSESADDNGEANARLIAAAPEMLELIELMILYVEANKLTSAPAKLANQARAILAQVREG